MFYRNAQSFAVATPLDLLNPVYGSAIPSLSPPNLNARQVTAQYRVYAQDQLRLDRFVLTAGVRQDWALADVEDRTLPGAAAGRARRTTTPSPGAPGSSTSPPAASRPTPPTPAPSSRRSARTSLARASTRCAASSTRWA